jgi:hypothetical protein
VGAGEREPMHEQRSMNAARAKLGDDRAPAQVRNLWIEVERGCELDDDERQKEALVIQVEAERDQAVAQENVGKASFEAAEAVCFDLDVMSLLEQLVNKSLVVMEENQCRARYAMLETIRQYARDKLIEAGEAATLRDRHLDYFLKYLEEAEPGLRSGEAFAWFDRLEVDYDNIRAAIEWGQEQRPVDTLLLIGNIIFYWTFRAADDRLQALHWLNDLVATVRALPADGYMPKRVMGAVARGQITAGLLLMGLGDTRLQPPRSERHCT